MSATRKLLPGVFIGSHAVAEGFLTQGQLRRRGYRRLVQGVFADPGLAFDHQLKCRGVALLLPEGTVVGGHSAAAWWGAPFARTTDPVTVLRPDDVAWRGPRGVRVHQTALRPADRTVRDDVPMTTPLRTAWDVAALEPLATAVAALDAMVAAETVALPELRRLARTGGRYGAARFRRAVELVDPRAQSPAESWVRVALVLAHLAPVPQYEIRAGGHEMHVDFAWPEAKVVLEYEGAYHFLEDGQLDRDDERIERLRAAGWLVIRISAADLRNLDAVVEKVRAALAARI